MYPFHFRFRQIKLDLFRSSKAGQAADPTSTGIEGKMSICHLCHKPMLQTSTPPLSDTTLSLTNTTPRDDAYKASPFVCGVLPSAIERVDRYVETKENDEDNLLKDGLKALLEWLPEGGRESLARDVINTDTDQALFEVFHNLLTCLVSPRMCSLSTAPVHGHF